MDSVTRRILAHLTDQIVPEPPDGPPDEPPTPADDLAPCPVCESSSMICLADDGIYIYCSNKACAVAGPTCQEFAEAIAAWDRLSTAAALLRAVEVIGQSRGMVRLWQGESGIWMATFAYSRTGLFGKGETPDTALIALAREVRHAS